MTKNEDVNSNEGGAMSKSEEIFLSPSYVEE
jgi:hypothetical protein